MPINVNSIARAAIMTSLFMRNSRLSKNGPVRDEIQATIESQEDEILSLRKQLSSLKSLYKEAKGKDSQTVNPLTQQRNEAIRRELSGDLIYQRQRIEKLLSVVAEKERQLRELQHESQSLSASNQEALRKEKRERQIALAEVEALHSQLSVLKAKYLEGQRVQKAQNQEIEALLTENKKTKVKIEEVLLAVEEKSRLQKEFDRISNVQTDLMLCLEEKTASIDALENTLKTKHQTLEEKDLKISNLVLTLEDAERKINSLQSEKSLAQDKTFQAQSAQEDAEARLKVAHFHLAKKVKEAALQTDLNEGLQAEVNELTTDLNDSLLKIKELQKHLEEQFLIEKRLQDKFQDSLRESAALANAWEEKYFNISEKWQEYELRFNDMKRLEDKFQKLHSQWINMGFLFDGLGQTSTIKHGSLSFESKSFESGVLNEPATEDIEIKRVIPAFESQLDMKQTYQTLEVAQSPKLFMSNILPTPPRSSK